MAFGITATSVSGNQVNIAVTDAAAAVTIYRTTTDYTSDIAAAFTENNLGTAKVSALSTASWSDYTTSSATTYYYYAFDGTDWTSATVTTLTPNEYKSDYVPPAPISITQSSAFVAAQNSAAAIRIPQIDLVSGNLCVVALKTSSEMTDADISALFIGTDVKFNILMNGSLPEVTDYHPTMSGSFTMRYAPDATS